MNESEIRQELAVIRSMLDKTRRETAGAGGLFIFMGAAAVFFVLAATLAETAGGIRWVMPVMAGLTVVNAVAGMLVIGRAIRRSSVTTYSGRVFIQLWVACSIALLLGTFVLPHLGAIPLQSVGVLAALVFGIGVFMTGVICDDRRIRWVSLVWPAAAVLMAANVNLWRMAIMIAAIAVGFILPGIWLRDPQSGSGDGREHADPS
jgi:hypothetical protein